jgi:GNAT superfamily N-acetyltransferase
MDDILIAYNQEFGKIHPIDQRLFKEKIINSEALLNSESYSLYNKQEFIACLALKRSLLLINKSKIYISFIYVAKKHRNKGIGKEILARCIKKSAKLGYNEIIVGGDEQCIFSGVFHKNNEHTHKFLTNSGFIANYSNINLILHKKVDVTYIQDDYDYILGVTNEQKKEAIEFVKQNFSPRWVMELSETENEDIGILLDNNKIIGFIRTGTKESKKLPNSLNDYLLFENLAGIGPLGVSKEYQGKGLGIYLVNKTIHELIKNGASDVMVDWTGLDKFYLKCGFTEEYEKYTIYHYSREKLQ